MVTITHKSNLVNGKECKMSKTKKVVIFGTVGHIEKYITEKMKAWELQINGRRKQCWIFRL